MTKPFDPGPDLYISRLIVANFGDFIGPCAIEITTWKVIQQITDRTDTQFPVKQQRPPFSHTRKEFDIPVK